MKYKNIIKTTWFCPKFTPVNVSWRSRRGSFDLRTLTAWLRRVELVLYLSLKSHFFYFLWHWNNHHWTYLHFKMINLVVFSCIGKVQRVLHLFTARKPPPTIQKNKIIVSNCWFRLLETSSPQPWPLTFNIPTCNDVKLKLIQIYR